MSTCTGGRSRAPLRAASGGWGRVGAAMTPASATAVGAAVGSLGAAETASGRAAATGAAGSVTTNAAPPPSALAAVTRPPCALTIPATIARPRPAPLLPRSRPPSARQKRSNSASGSSVGRPGPWSRTSSRTSWSAALTPTSIGLPAGVCTSALRSRLPSTWRSWWASPSTTAVPSQRDLDRAVGRGRAGVAGGVAGEAGRGRPRRAARRRPRRAAPASAGPRRARPCAPPRPRSAASTARPRAGSRAAPIRCSSA